MSDKLLAECFIADGKNVNHTTAHKAIIMLEIEGYVKVRKGSGIHVISNQPRHYVASDGSLELASYGLFELLQMRQLIGSNIVEPVIIRVAKQDIVKLMEIQRKSHNEKSFRDPEWDLQSHVQAVLATQNSVLATIVEKIWTRCIHNSYWKKLHDHIDLRTVDSWCDDHDRTFRALIRKDPRATKLAARQHLENTKQMLFNEASDDLEFSADRYLFTENPAAHLGTAANSAR